MNVLTACDYTDERTDPWCYPQSAPRGFDPAGTVDLLLHPGWGDLPHYVADGFWVTAAALVAVVVVGVAKSAKAARAKTTQTPDPAMEGDPTHG